MIMYNEELRALRVAIEHLNWMLKQKRYKDDKMLLLSKKEQYLKELEYLLEGE